MADLNRIIQAAARAALEDGSQGRTQQTAQKVKRKGLTTPRAVLVGAGLFTVGRLLVRSGGRDLVETLQHRLEEFEHEHGAREDLEDAPEDEYDEDFDEPEDEYDEEFDEPEDEFDPEDEDEQPEDDESEDDPEDEEPEDDEREEPEEEEGEEPEERPRAGRASRSASR